MIDYDDLYIRNPGRGRRSINPDKIHYDDPIDTSVKHISGNSRKWDNASLEVKKQAIDSIIDISSHHQLSFRNTAHVLVIAYLESGFNPDTASGMTIASSLVQFFRTVLLMALIVLACISSVMAEEAENCDNYSGDHTKQVQCISSRIQNLDIELNEVYKQALASLPEKEKQDERKEKEQLRKSQRAWLKFKDENCALVGGLQDGNNLWVTHFATLCEEQQLKERIRFI